MFPRLLAFVLLFTFTAALGAQTGLPQYGVLLAGTPSAPQIINQSPYRILAYTVAKVLPNGNVVPSTYSMLGPNTPATAGIAPGTTFSPQGALRTQVRDASGRPPDDTGVTFQLDSVVFDDGRLVGPDRANSFDQHTARIQAEEDVHGLVRTAERDPNVWKALDAVAARDFSALRMPPGKSEAYQRMYQAMAMATARSLTMMRGARGEAAAIAAARQPKNYLALRRVQ